MVRLLRRERLGADKLDMLPGEIQYAKELLDLLFSLTGDQRFKAAIAQSVEMQKKGEPIKLTSFLEQAEMRGRSEGIAIGEERGRAEGRRDMMDRLITEKGWDPQEAASFAGLTL